METSYSVLSSPESPQLASCGSSPTQHSFHDIRRQQVYLDLQDFHDMHDLFAPGSISPTASSLDAMNSSPLRSSASSPPGSPASASESAYATPGLLSGDSEGNFPEDQDSDIIDSYTRMESASGYDSSRDIRSSSDLPLDVNIRYQGEPRQIHCDPDNISDTESDCTVFSDCSGSEFAETINEGGSKHLTTQHPKTALLHYQPCGYRYTMIHDRTLASNSHEIERAERGVNESGLAPSMPTRPAPAVPMTVIKPPPFTRVSSSDNNYVSAQSRPASSDLEEARVVTSTMLSTKVDLGSSGNTSHRHWHDQRNESKEKPQRSSLSAYSEHSDEDRGRRRYTVNGSRCKHEDDAMHERIDSCSSPSRIARLASLANPTQLYMPTRNEADSPEESISLQRQTRRASNATSATECSHQGRSNGKSIPSVTTHVLLGVCETCRKMELNQSSDRLLFNLPTAAAAGAAIAAIAFRERDELEGINTPDGSIGTERDKPLLGFDAASDVAGRRSAYENVAFPSRMPPAPPPSSVLTFSRRPSEQSTSTLSTFGSLQRNSASSHSTTAQTHGHHRSEHSSYHLDRSRLHALLEDEKWRNEAAEADLYDEQVEANSEAEIWSEIDLDRGDTEAEEAVSRFHYLADRERVRTTTQLRAAQEQKDGNDPALTRTNNGSSSCNQRRSQLPQENVWRATSDLAALVHDLILEENAEEESISQQRQREGISEYLSSPTLTALNHFHSGPLQGEGADDARYGSSDFGGSERGDVSYGVNGGVPGLTGSLETATSSASFSLSSTASSSSSRPLPNGPTSQQVSVSGAWAKGGHAHTDNAYDTNYDADDEMKRHVTNPSVEYVPLINKGTKYRRRKRTRQCAETIAANSHSSSHRSRGRSPTQSQSQSQSRLESQPQVESICISSLRTLIDDNHDPVSINDNGRNEMGNDGIDILVPTPRNRALFEHQRWQQIQQMWEDMIRGDIVGE